MFLESRASSIDPRLERVMLIELDRLDRLARLFREDSRKHEPGVSLSGASEAGARGLGSTGARDHSDAGTQRRAA